MLDWVLNMSLDPSSQELFISFWKETFAKKKKKMAEFEEKKFLEVVDETSPNNYFYQKMSLYNLVKLENYQSCLPVF